MKNKRIKIRHKWDINPATKVEPDRRKEILNELEEAELERELDEQSSNEE